jgi:CRP-like cAMP-binding protein
LMTVLKDNFLTSALSEEDTIKIILALEQRHYSKGEVICNYGEPGEEYFILQKGLAEVKVMDDDGVLEGVK